MKITNLLQVFILSILTLSLSSCAVIEGIFKTGFGIGIFVSVCAVIFIVGIILFIRRRSK